MAIAASALLAAIYNAVISTGVAIADNSITAAKVADGAIDAATFAAGAINAAAIADGAIDNATFAADVGSTAYATNAIALAADKAIVTEALAAAVDLAAVKSDTTAILVDTGTTLDGRIPAALVSGRMDVSVGAMAAGVVTAAAVATGAIDADALATDAVNEIVDGVWDEARADHVVGGTFGSGVASVAGAVNSVTNNVNASVTAVAAGAITAAAIADAAIDAATFAAGAIDAAAIAAGAIDAATLATDLDTYQAKVWLIDDDGAGTPTDRYVVAWFKNAQPIVAGITTPLIQVIKAADGSDLVAESAMTQIAATGLFRYDETTNRIADGAVYMVKCTATIAAAARTWYQPIGRDSAA